MTLEQLRQLEEEHRRWTRPVSLAMRVYARSRARRISAVHEGDSSTHDICLDPGGSHYVGNLGEMVFAMLFQLSWDPNFVRPHGENDGGIDFAVPPWRIDVKCRSVKRDLLRKMWLPNQGDTILVHAYYNSKAQEVSLLGWAFDREVFGHEPLNLGRGLPCFSKDTFHLRRMESLAVLLEGCPRLAPRHGELFWRIQPSGQYKMLVASSNTHPSGFALSSLQGV